MTEKIKIYRWFFWLVFFSFYKYLGEQNLNMPRIFCHLELLLNIWSNSKGFLCEAVF